MSELVASTYRILGDIARTDTGTVFEAHDTMLDRLVALKLAPREHGKPSLVVEARRCAAVRAPCAVQIHGMGVHAGAEYAVAERVTGRLLRDDVERAPSTDVFLARWRTLIAAVARAHAVGIAIGDISCSTVLVTGDDRLVLGRLSLSQVPSLDLSLGNPVAGERIDLYGLGCVAIEMAGGAPPFASERLAELRPDLPGELSDLVAWLLVAEPAGRPASARDVLAQVDAVIERMGTGTRPVRVLIIDDDAARARWLWGLARRAHAATLVEIATEGTDAAHKLNRDQPDLVFISAALRGVMNALELCMYARGLESPGYTLGDMILVGDMSERDRALFAEVSVPTIPADAQLPAAILARIRAAFAHKARARTPRTTVSG